MGLRVLVVEDNQLVTDAMAVLLEAHGHAVATAASLADAVAHCRAGRPELVLLDLTLPDGHGLRLFDLLAEADTPPATVALTGHDDHETRARCLAAGCRDVLVKPVPTRELVARLRAWEIELRADAQPPTG
ncbi:MAG TPA: response regulator [Gemmatimonadaceae bacterium]|nr:response regulator [Gemmatimonadaceae bacterium]